MQEQIEKDLKLAMLAGDKAKTETLRGLKNAIQNEIIRVGAKQTGISDEQMQRVLVKEAKQRQESAYLYQKANETERAKKELAEKAIIETYLPEALDEDELKVLISKHITALRAESIADMGKVIGAVCAEAGASADGATVARLVREALGA